MRLEAMRYRSWRRGARRSLPIVAGTGLTFVLTAAVAFAAPGKLDPGFGTRGVVSTATGPGAGDDFQNGLEIQADGKILVGGSSAMGPGAGGGNWRLARYTKKGVLDPGFGNGGVVTTNMSSVGGDDEHIWGVAVLPDGKVVAVGHARTPTGGVDWGIARYNPDGTLDDTFGGDGTLVRAVGPGTGTDTLFEVLVDDSGNIVAGGRATMSAAEGGRNFALARFKDDGALDSSFNPGGPTPGIVVTAVGAGSRNDQMTDIAFDDGGRIVASGLADMGPGAGGVDFALARYSSSGSLDASFDGDGKLTFAIAPGDNFENINSLAIAGNGAILIGGATDMGASAGGFDWALARFSADGSPDVSFGAGGKLNVPIGSSDDDLESLVIQPTGKIVGGGSSSDSGLGVDDDFTVGRFNADGTLDAAFGSNGVVVTPMGPGSDAIFEIVLTSDAKVVGSGECDQGGTGVDVCVVRIKAGEGD